MSKIFARAIKRMRPEFSPKRIFDVGANVGQSTTLFSTEFPAAQICAFEPAPASFARLTACHGDTPGVRLFQLGFSHTAGRAGIAGQSVSTGNQLQATTEGAPDTLAEVEVTTGDAFCAEHGIDEIDLLKVDTEGADLDVIAGFSHTLAARRIEFVQVETTTSLDNRFHVHLERFIHFLHPFNYRLFGLFEASHKVMRTNQKLNGIWFCNAVFVREVADPVLRRDGRN